jgi:acyl-CoA synthetase (NDP forming)
VACYSDTGELLGPVGRVVVNSTQGPAVVSACGHAGVRFVAIISSGTAEEFDGADRPTRAVGSDEDDVGCHSAE